MERKESTIFRSPELEVKMPVLYKPTETGNVFHLFSIMMVYSGPILLQKILFSSKLVSSKIVLQVNQGYYA